jgi:hypothetical protein
MRSGSPAGLLVFLVNDSKTIEGEELIDNIDAFRFGGDDLGQAPRGDDLRV